MALLAPGFAQGILNAQQQQQADAQRKQQMDYQAWQIEQAKQQQARQLQAQQNYGSVLNSAYGMPPPVAGGQGQGPQPPAPGQTSVPMAPPQSPNGGMGGMQGAAPPMAQGIMPGESGGMPTRPPQMGGGLPPYQTVQSLAQGQPPQSGGMQMMQPPAPPATNDIGTKPLTVASVVQLLKAQGVPQDQWYDTMAEMKPLFDEQNKQELTDMKRQMDAANIAKTAYQLAYEGKKIDLQALGLEQRGEHYNVMEGQGQQRIEQGAQRIGQGQQRINQGQTASQLTPEAKDLLDDLALRDPSFMSRMGVKNLTERNRIVSDWAAKGYTADDVISKRLGTKEQTKEVQVLANQAASLARVEKAITDKGGIGDQVEAAAKKLDASKLKQFNKVSQLLQSETSDPDLSAYKVKLIALRDEFATVINKGGQPTEGSRRQATEIMDQYAPTAIPSIVKAVKDVVKSNQKAANDALADAKKSSGAPGTKENPIKLD